jgi:hypothetical protein
MLQMMLQNGGAYFELSVCDLLVGFYGKRR